MRSFTRKRRELSKKIMKTSVVLGLLLTTVGVGQALASDSDKFCSVASGGYLTCVNSMAKTDTNANFSNAMEDRVQATDAYHIKFITTTWKPKVLRGSPVYKNYTVVDNYNRETLFTNNDYYGKYLEDYSQVTLGIGKTAGYYPQSYGSPVSSLQVQNLRPQLCNVATMCKTYTQASQFSVSSAKSLIENTESQVYSGLSALSSNEFNIKLPEVIPFDGQEPTSQRSEVGGVTTAEVTYVSKDQEAYLTIQAINADNELVSDLYEINDGVLENNAKTHYLDNDTVQMLQWEQDGLSYTILASADNKIFNQTELEEIANSMK